MLTKWKMLHPKVTEEWCGLLIYMLDDSNPKSAKEQLNDGYQHGGGWSPFKGFKLTEKGLVYPGDPPMRPIAEAKLRDEIVRLYESSWVAIIQPNGGFEVCRMD